MNLKEKVMEQIKDQLKESPINKIPMLTKNSKKKMIDNLSDQFFRIYKTGFEQCYRAYRMNEFLKIEKWSSELEIDVE